MSSNDDYWRKQQEDRKRDLFYEALRDRNKEMLIYAATSTETYLNYLKLRDAPQDVQPLGPSTQEASQASREDSESALRLWLISLVDSVSGMPASFAIDGVVWQLEKKFKFGKLYRSNSTSGNPEFDQLLAEFDDQKVTIVRAILAEVGMIPSTKIHSVLQMSSLRLESPMAWAECKLLAEFLQPYNFSFQLALESLGDMMYGWFKRSSLGGFY